MKRRVLVFYYSLSGSLFRAISRALEAISSDLPVVFYPIEPEKPFKFPCSWQSFFRYFPEAVLQIPCRIKGVTIDLRADDIIILAFQPWFLHPSLPVSAFIRSNHFGRIVRNREVVLFTCSRNTWINALRIVRERVDLMQGMVIAEVAIADSAGEYSSALDFIRWFFTGRNNPFDVILNRELPRVREQFREVLLDSRSQSPFTIPLEHMPGYSFEKRVVRRFTAWASFIRNSSGRHTRLIRSMLFQAWILFALIFISPLMKLILKNKTYGYGT